MEWKGVKQALLTGRGRVVLRGKCHIDTKPSGREQIVITDVPYQVNRDGLTDRIGQLVNDKTIEGVAHVNNESNNKEGTRIVVDLKRDAGCQRDRQPAFQIHGIADELWHQQCCTQQRAPEDPELKGPDR
jgi:DNA gyrase/topoisomerase IV subunit A